VEVTRRFGRESEVVAARVTASAENGRFKVVVCDGAGEFAPVLCLINTSGDYAEDKTYLADERGAV